MDIEKENRHLRASVRKWKAIATGFEKQAEVADRIIEAISYATPSPITPPKMYIPTTSEHEEVAVLLMSDVHIGKKTTTYNPTVFTQRLTRLTDSMLSVVSAQRTIRPIRKLVIVMNGDFIDCEAVYPSQAVDYIALPIIDQIYTVGMPEMSKFLLTCLANFEEVECYCQRGNHGRQNAAKWSSSQSTNWDYVFYKSLQTATVNQPRLTWNINTKDWKQTFRVASHGFLACHGDMILRYYNLPYYGMTRQAMRWQNAYRDHIKLTYFMFGHFHSAGIMRFNNCVILMNGSFVTSDPYAEEHIGVASVPEQLLFGVHPKYGVSWRYTLKL